MFVRDRICHTTEYIKYILSKYTIFSNIKKELATLQFSTVLLFLIYSYSGTFISLSS